MRPTAPDFFDLNPSPSWICTEGDYSIIKVNRAAIDLFGFSKEVWSQKKLVDVLSFWGSFRPKASYSVTARTKNGDKVVLRLWGDQIEYNGTPCIYFIGHVESPPEVPKNPEEVSDLDFIANHTGNAVILTDKEGSITWGNRSYELITGYPLKESLGKKFDELLSGPDANAVSLIKHALDKFTNARTEMEIYTKSGKKYWVDIEVIPRYDSSDNVTGFMIVGSDIAAKKIAVQEMLNVKERLQTILDNAPVMVFMKDLKGRYIFYNKAYRDMYPVLLENSDATEYDLFDKNLADTFRVQDEHIIKTKDTIHLEESILVDGIPEVYWTIKFPMHDREGELYAVGGVVLRITDHKRVARLDKIVKESYNEIYLFHWDTLQFEFANASALKNIGYAEDEFLKLKFSDLFNFPDEMALRALLAPLRRGETDRLQLRMKHSRKSGTYYDVDTLIQVLEKNRSFVVIATDITEHLRTEKKLMSTILEKELLIREIHHRVKNNLQLISSIIYIKMASQADPEIRHFLESTRQKIRSIALIHERLLQSEKLGKVEISDYLGKLIHEIQAGDLRPDLALELTTDIEGGVFDLDRGIYIGLILNELVTNAIKHAFTGRRTGIIDVVFRREEDKSVLSVKDNGITLPLNVQPGKSDSFGMNLIDILVRQLGGVMTIIREQGTEFRCVFSL